MPLRMTTGTPVVIIRNTIDSHAHMISRDSISRAIRRMKEVSHKGAYLPLSGLEGLPINRATILSKRGQYPGSAAAGDSFRHETLHMLSHHGAARAHRVETRPPSRPLSSGFARAPRYVYVRVRSVLTQRVGTVRCGAVRSRDSNLALDAVAAQCRHVFSYSLTADGLLPTRPLGRVRSRWAIYWYVFEFRRMATPNELQTRNFDSLLVIPSAARNNMFSLEERFEILKIYFQSQCCVAETVRILKRNMGRDRAPTEGAIRKLEHDSPMLRTVLLLGRLLLETPSLGIHTLEPDWLLRRSVEFNSATRESPVIRAFRQRDS
ncbi:hypothetical protein G5I_04928 [Acromyrmex echinatior]|uniref:DUF4817 domain-containing protein n=1 Tax=Acromyrmex echinatior TaxID=103372 RepID=F4WGX7_ACREC|nr:hypothetical protein G5I_04928 [Acromyrmex echinatior]